MTDFTRHRVLKFGGTSVGSPESLRHALGIAADAARESPVAIVVSALSGVTDQLAALAQGVGRGLDSARILAALRDRHTLLLSAVAKGPARRDGESAATAVWAGLDRDLARIASGGDRTRCDAILAAGERLAVPLFVAGLRRTRPARRRPVDGTAVIRTDDGWGEAQVDFAATAGLVDRRLASLPRDVVPVVTGFVGGTADGRTTVLGRGGSDYTAAILGAALGAVRVDIWTDVDGILSADPHLVDDAFTLAQPVLRTRHRRSRPWGPRSCTRRPFRLSPSAGSRSSSATPAAARVRARGSRATVRGSKTTVHRSKPTAHGSQPRRSLQSRSTATPGSECCPRARQRPRTFEAACSRCSPTSISPPARAQRPTEPRSPSWSTPKTGPARCAPSTLRS